MSGQISNPAVLTELSGLLSRHVDERDLRRARLHLLDWSGCAIAGAKEPAGSVLRKMPVKDASAQAFVWGGLGNILEMDDVDKRALLHPGPSIIPAALAAAVRAQSDMSQLLAAIVTGYEATIRLGRAVGPAHYAKWHSTGTCGAIGAAAASAFLLELTEEERAHAMALAISQSAGLWHTRHDADSMGKQLHTAVAARAGLDAAQLARDGFRGPLSILEGEQGFFAAMCEDGQPMQICARQDAQWAIQEVSFKPWPACRHAHAAIDAALKLRDQVSVSEIKSLTVRTYQDALKFCDRPNPQTVIEAKFSLQHSVAVTLLSGAPGLDDFGETAIRSPEVAELRGKVRVEVADVYQARYPSRFGAEIQCGDRKVVIEDALGDPENPVSDIQIRQKAAALMAAAGLSETSRLGLCDAVLSDTATAQKFIQNLQEMLA
ncbi:MAG: MmgE/PrpD family protein [Pseudomonadota bacterium]